MCVKTVINTLCKKINHAINVINFLNNCLTVLVVALLQLSFMLYFLGTRVNVKVSLW